MFYPNTNGIGLKSFLVFTTFVSICLLNIIEIEYPPSFLHYFTINHTPSSPSSRELLNVNKSSCDCYALKASLPLKANTFIESPYNIICEFEEIILHEQKLYTDQAYCSIYTIDNPSEWTKQNRIKLKKQKDKVDQLPIQQIVIQPVLEEDWMGARNVQIYPCNNKICHSDPDISVEESGYYHHFYAQENIAHTLLENYIPIYVLMQGWDIEKISNRVMLAVQDTVTTLNTQLSVIFGFEKILCINHMKPTKFKHLVIGTFGACFNTFCGRNYNIKQFQAARDYLIKRIKPVINKSTFFNSPHIVCSRPVFPMERIVLLVNRGDHGNRKIVNFPELMTSMYSINPAATGINSVPICNVSSMSVLKIEEQLALYHRSQVVIQVFGAAMANFIALSPNTAVIVIRPRGWTSKTDPYGRLLLGLLHSVSNINEISLQLKDKGSVGITSEVNRIFKERSGCKEDFDGECVTACCYIQVSFRTANVMLSANAISSIMHTTRHAINDNTRTITTSSNTNNHHHNKNEDVKSYINKHHQNSNAEFLLTHVTNEEYLEALPKVFHDPFKKIFDMK